MGLLDSFTGALSSPDGSMTPAAQGLLAAGLGVLAHNRGLTSGTQAIGMGGLEGVNAYAGAKQAQMQQQLQNAQLQQLGFALKKNQLLYDTAANLLGGGGTAQAQSPAPAPAQPVAQTDIGGVSDGGSSASGGPIGAAPSLGGAPITPQSAQPSPRPLFGNIPNNLAGFGLMTNPDKLFEIAANQYAPTDLQKQLTAANIPQGSPEWNQALRAAITKSTRIDPVALRPGGAYIGSDGQLHSTPAAAPAGFENIPLADGSWRTVPVQGGLDALTASTGATARGNAGYKLQQVWDPTANGGKGGYVQQTVTNIADAAGGRGGAGQPPPIPTIPGLTGNSGIGSGDSGVPLPSMPGSAPAQGGPMASEPPMGAKSNADSSQKAGADAMTASYGRLQAARATGQQALEAIDKMQQLAAKKSPLLTAGPLGTDLTSVNPSAAEYQKQRANLITMLANQNGTNGTDAGRALTGDSVPDYGKPISAIKDGLSTQASQVRLNMLKSNMLTPYFNSGDSNKYNALENEFDQTIKPSMMPALTNVLAMPAGKDRADALSSAAKDPHMRAALELLVKGGMLK